MPDMADLLARAQPIFTAIETQNASASHVELLHQLLWSNELGTVVRPTSTASTRTSRHATSHKSARTASKPESASGPDDATLSKRRDALATEISNLSLRALARIATKPIVNSTNSTTSAIQQNGTLEEASVPRVGGRDPIPSRPRPALKPRSGNTSRSSKTSSSPEGNKPRRAGNLTVDQSSSIVATAQCAREALAHLNAGQRTRHGAVSSPDLKLTSAMLALVANLITLDQIPLAVKELQMVKLQLSDGPSRDAEVSCTSKMGVLSSLLDISTGQACSPQLLQLTVRYHMLVMKVLAISRQAGTVEDAIKYMGFDNSNSLASLLKVQSALPDMKEKSVLQLQSLSQTLLSFCPSVSASSDHSACLNSAFISPVATFRLQALAFETRKAWWELAGHQPDYDKELVQPFAKCVWAFSRRLPASSPEPSEIAETAYLRLSRGVPAKALGWFEVYRASCHLVEQFNATEPCIKWLDRMLSICPSQQESGALRITCELRRISIRSKPSENPYDAQSDLDSVTRMLRGKPTGSSSDFDTLISELSDFVRNVCAAFTATTKSASIASLVSHAGAFALRYFRSAPSRNGSIVRQIVLAAIQHSETIGNLAAWITEDAIHLFNTEDELHKVSQMASKTMGDATWSFSSLVLTLDRVINGLAAKSLLNGVMISLDRGFPTDASSQTATETILGRYLKWIERLVVHSKYRRFLGDLLPKLSHMLFNVYSANDYPIRRAQVNRILLELRQLTDDPTDYRLFEGWNNRCSIDNKSLGNDRDLEPYLAHVQASLDLASAFDSGTPCAATFKASFSVWDSILSGQSRATRVASEIDDLEHLRGQLLVASDYLSATGDDATRLSSLLLIERIAEITGSGTIDSYLNTAAHLHTMGKFAEVDIILTKISSTNESLGLDAISALKLLLTKADYTISQQRFTEARSLLSKAAQFYGTLTPGKLAKPDRRTLHRMHAEAWLLESRCCLLTGAACEALLAAKHALRILNSIWASFQQTDPTASNPAPNTDPTEESNLDNVTVAVSKLNLTGPTAKPEQSRQLPTACGPLFWPLVPLLVGALSLLSDLYCHHGLYHDANYYSEQAILKAGLMPSSKRLATLNIRRAELLVLAGRVEDAELCIARLDLHAAPIDPVVEIKRHIAQAAIMMAGEYYEEAVEVLKEALQVADHHSTQSIAHVNTIKAKSGKRPTGSQRQVRKDPSAAPARGRATRAKNASQPRRQPKSPSQDLQQDLDDGRISRPWHGLYITLCAAGAAAAIKAGDDAQEWIDKLNGQNMTTSEALQIRVVSFCILMEQARTEMQSNFALNILPESTLAIPAFRNLETVGSQKLATMASKTRAKKTDQHAALKTILTAAQQLLVNDRQDSLLLSSTSAMYRESLLLSSNSILLAATSPNESRTGIHTVAETLEVARTRALHLEAKVNHGERIFNMQKGRLQWPGTAGATFDRTAPPADDQETITDVLPASWTAVSLTLSDDASELYMVRYRAGLPPFIIRLPFARHKPDVDGSGGEDEDEIFDFSTGKKQLREIIERSNLSCHGTSKIEEKGARNQWWTERQSLDRLLHQLLLNIESMWLGGFRSMLSPRGRRPVLLERFGKSLESILDRHLPSRSKGKPSPTRLVLEDHILDLFTNLCNTSEDVDDIDEPLTDLLYFIVDMLQFNGEQNAYDEIDFDTICIAVADALRLYHDDLAHEPLAESEHLILVLEKRLQIFPWESLPFLDRVSVSRVGSVLSLRERILAMRDHVGMSPEDQRHVVSNRKGTYILNPSSDLKSTQATLGPILQHLSDPNKHMWTAMVDHAPTELEFETSLSESPIILYFGHGAGTQYIRQRTIRRLQSCSQIVWLMGCSSGAVTEHGELEPEAVPLSYLLAGPDVTELNCEDTTCSEAGDKCMAVLATLWDVTDKDIDRFSLAVGEEWGLWPPSESSHLPEKTLKKKERMYVASTPAKMPKTPKTPKVQRTFDGAKIPLRTELRKSTAAPPGQKSLTEAVADSRDSCFLRYLNGAAPVVYGIPVYLGE